MTPPSPGSSRPPMPGPVRLGIGLLVASVVLGLAAIALAAPNPEAGPEAASKLQEAVFGALVGALALVGIWAGFLWVVFLFLGLSLLQLGMTVYNPEPFQAMLAQHPIVIGLNLVSQGLFVAAFLVLLTPGAWAWFRACRERRRQLRRAQEAARRGR